MQAVLGLGAVLVAPGYALVSLLFPRRAPGAGLFEDRGGRISPGERFVLSVGASVCLVPLVGLGLVLLSFGATTSLFQFSIGAMTVLLAFVAAGRRLEVSPAERFSPLRAPESGTRPCRWSGDEHIVLQQETKLKMLKQRNCLGSRCIQELVNRSHVLQDLGATGHSFQSLRSPLGGFL